MERTIERFIPTFFYFYMNFKEYIFDNIFTSVQYRVKKRHATWWCMGGHFHRIDGPAIEYIDGRTAYWVEGINMPRERFDRLYGLNCPIDLND